MTVDYDKISIAVFVDEKQLDSTVRLFRFLLGSRVVDIKNTDGCYFLTGQNFTVRIAYPRGDAYRGWRSHYVLNTVQDIDFDEYIAQPMTHIHSLLNKEVWRELFE